MEVNNTDPNNHHQPHHHHQYHQSQSPSAAVSNAVPTSFYLSSHLNTSGICYGVGESGAFHSPLSVMPLKSDGSLCIMEALTRSQPEVMVSSSSPKLEDFLGGATMETHHHQYGSHERETMALSLDSMYYHNHHAETENNRQQQHSLDLLQEQFRQQQQQQFQAQTHHPYYVGMPCHGGMYQSPMEEEETTKDNINLTHCASQIPHQLSDDAMPFLKIGLLDTTVLVLIMH
ncbi:hypothetical protein LWI28_015719 [Acer negundo]|uniref:Uncharacterized protein n=1 Tax=Acer negundo TaxID=4023 RepID=A0AAD5JI14_ACENE|nr:hypothetical protein LWI28_015719 [Acer negundo]